MRIVVVVSSMLVAQAGKVASRIDGRFEVPAHGTSTMPVWGRILGKPISDGLRLTRWHAVRSMRS